MTRNAIAVHNDASANFTTRTGGVEAFLAAIDFAFGLNIFSANHGFAFTA